MYKVPFLDLRIMDQEEKKLLLQDIEKVFDHGQFILGPEVAAFEKMFADYCEKKYAVSVNSGTDALFLLLKALGIGVGDEVITTSLSWVATANAIRLTGATPVFADIRDDLNIDPNSILQLINKKTKAILPVHYCGRICDMPAILSIAKEKNLMVIEDASQVVGSAYMNKPPGSFADYACFSLNPMKVFAACGEAGVIVCNSQEMYEKLIALRYNGMVEREFCVEPSLNCRIDTIQAAILLSRFSAVNKIVEKRRKIAEFYHKNLSDKVIKPIENNNEFNNYYTYTIQVNDRDNLRRFLFDAGIETKIHHPILMSQQKPYCDFNYRKPMNAEKLVKQIISLPCHEKMSDDQFNFVCERINYFLKA